ncbi:hypothetical protein OEA41_002029 [Lepraria neglecta]|uniref:NB-ARC domain-containing protein n=1 Tax=Lepraria neglecta TaxID=209136 RepID=A0AAE0DPJ7_9LECA|nr:hypothetical protein OEA41_002029 [Lepraria neglecta]
MAAASSGGNAAEKFYVDGQGQVQIGDRQYCANPTIEAFQGSQIFQGNFHGLTINPTAAAQTTPDTYEGHYSKSSLRPVTNYIQRPTPYEQVRRQLHPALTEKVEETTILVVWGLGGAGKSQLILDYLRKHRGDYTATFWIEAGRKESVERDFLQIYRLLFNRGAVSEGESIKAEDAVSDVKRWFSRQHGRWLLVFDSADLTEDEEDPSYYDLRCYLPDSPGVQIVITTRAEWIKKMTLLDAVEVGEMEEIEAVNLFFQSSKIKDQTQETEVEVGSIVRELGYLALAISIAGSYVSATPRLSMKITSYLPEYRSRRAELLRQKPNRIVHHYGESVLTTWETSFDAITRQCPGATKLMGLLAFLNNDDILPGFFDQNLGYQESGEDVVIPSIYTVEEAFRCLQAFSLIQWKEDQGSYSMHKLVHAWSYDRLSPEKQRSFSGGALRLLQTIVSGCEPHHMHRIRLVPHVMVNFMAVSQNYAETDSEDRSVLKLLPSFADFLNTVGRWSDVFLIRIFLLKHSQRVLGEEHPDTLTAMNNLANSLSEKGRLDETASMSQQVLEKRRRILGEEHPDTIRAISNLANSLSDQGQLDKALSIQQEVLEKIRRILNEEHLDTISAMNNLANIFRRQGQLDKAVLMQQEVLEKRRHVLGEKHSNTISAMNNLAATLSDQGRLDEAASMRQQVLEKRHCILGEEHPDTISAMSNLAISLGNQDRLNEAVSMNYEVLEKRRRILGEEHPGTITAMNNLAVTLRDQGRLDEAASMRQKVLEKRQRKVGEEH